MQRRVCAVTTIALASLQFVSGCQRDTPRRFGQPLLDAVAAGDAAAVSEVLRTGVDIDAVDDSGKTALHWAAYYGTLSRNADVTALLLQHGADVNARDRAGRTPLSGARGPVACALRANGGIGGVARRWIAGVQLDGEVLHVRGERLRPMESTSSDLERLIGPPPYLRVSATGVQTWEYDVEPGQLLIVRLRRWRLTIESFEVRNEC